MKYNTAIEAEATAANEYFDKLVDAGKVVEVKEIRKSRSLNQNNYLHLLLGAFGLNFGYSIEESKQIFKRLSQDTFYYYKKDSKGKKVWFIRSTADLNTKQMSDAIDKFMKYSAENGYALPLATDEAWLREISNQIEREGRRYL